MLAPAAESQLAKQLQKQTTSRLTAAPPRHQRGPDWRPSDQVLGLGVRRVLHLCAGVPSFPPGSGVCVSALATSGSGRWHKRPEPLALRSAAGTLHRQCRRGLGKTCPVPVGAWRSGDYPESMTRDEAIAEVERRRAAEPGASWIASQRDGDWVVVRLGVAPTKVSGTATKPPPIAPEGDPHSPIERAAWFAGGGG